MNKSISNEWQEFLDYTTEPIYTVKNKKDNTFLGRFTMDMLMENYGFARVLTILARGYLFHNPDGTPKDGNAYDRTDYARRALCAWCSLPDSKKATPKAEWQYKTDFRNLHGEFPELVDESGCGWYYRHLHSIADFINANRDSVGKSTHKIADNIDGLDTAWRKKVSQFQNPIFSDTTKGDFIIRFDDVISDALELGALRCEPVVLTEEQEQWLTAVTPQNVPLNVTHALLEYYLASKPTDCEWCVLPVTNIEAFLGSSALNRMYLKQLDGAVLQRKENALGFCVYIITYNTIK